MMRLPRWNVRAREPIFHTIWTPLEERCTVKFKHLFVICSSHGRGVLSSITRECCQNCASSFARPPSHENGPKAPDISTRPSHSVHPLSPVLLSLSRLLTTNKPVHRNKMDLNLAHGVQLGRLRTELRDVTRSLKIVKEQLQVRSIVGNERGGKVVPVIFRTFDVILPGRGL